MDKVATAKPLMIEGDAYLAIAFTAQVKGPLDIIHSDATKDDFRSRLVEQINAPNSLFKASKLDWHKKTLKGQGVDDKVEFKEAIVSFEVDKNKERSLNQIYLEELYKEFEPGKLNGLKVEKIDVILFHTGLFSVNIMLLLPNGWQNEKVVHLFGPNGQDKLMNTVRRVFPRPLAELSLELATGLRKLRNSMELNAANNLEVWAKAFEKKAIETFAENEATSSENKGLKIPAICIVYGGTIQSCNAQNDYLDERYRSLFYMSNAGRITSHSPDPCEFIRFGYAFSMVARKERVVDRVEEAVFSIRLEHYMYAQLVSLCELAEQQLRSEVTITADEAKRLRQLITENVNKLRSGGFTYRHELIVFQDRIFEAWFLDRLIARAYDTLKLLVEDRERDEQLRSIRRDRMLGAILAIIALFSLVSVAADAIQLMQYFGQ
jgi:hypothetical protein